MSLSFHFMIEQTMVQSNDTSPQYKDAIHDYSRTWEGERCTTSCEVESATTLMSVLEYQYKMTMWEGLFFSGHRRNLQSWMCLGYGRSESLSFGIFTYIHYNLPYPIDLKTHPPEGPPQL